MTKLTSKITAVLMLAFIGVFMVFSIFGSKKSRSSEENRELSKRPGISSSSLLDGSFAEQLGLYSADHFPLRSKWLKLNSKLREEIGDGIINGVYAADDMLLDADTSRRASSGSCAAEINRFARDHSGAVYVVAVPTSSGVYRERLPEYLDDYRESQQISDFYEKLNKDIKRIDAYNILKMLNSNYIYYRSDTKWTSYGAYCVYRTVIQKLGFLPTTFDKYSIRHVTSDFRGNLYNRSLCTSVKPDIMDFYYCSGGAEVLSCTGVCKDKTIVSKRIYDEQQLESDYLYNAYLGESIPLLRIKTSVNNERKLLVIKDSYADCFIPFLTQHYSEIDVLSPELLDGSASDFVDFDKYEQTLFLFGIENLSDSSIFASLNR
ncbi:MAG: hypothetical protein K5884_03545 [Ruminococcus sp.]|nr:hypothetical protein [Ruminococcus sp.]